jgi:hypothetical protein
MRILSLNLVKTEMCEPAKIFLTSEFYLFYFLEPHHKTKTGMANRQIGRRLLITTHLGQSNYLAIQGAVNKYDLTPFIICAFSRVAKTFFQPHS